MKLFWTPERLIRTIKKLDEAGIDLASRAFKQDRTDFTSKVIYRATKRRVKGSTFYMAARNRFGSWRKALSSAGLPADKHVKYRRYWNQFLVREAIRALSDSDITLRSGSLTWDTSPALSEIIFKRTGFKVTGSKLMNGARRVYGSWHLALADAGALNGNLSISKRRGTPHRKTPLTMTWSANTLKAVIWQMSRQETDLRNSNIFKPAKKKALEGLISRQFEGLSLSQVVRLAIDHHGSWRRSVALAGLDPHVFLKRVRRSKPRAISEIPHRVQVERDQDGRKQGLLVLGETIPCPEEALLRRQMEKALNCARAKLRPRLQVVADRLLDSLHDDTSPSGISVLEAILANNTGMRRRDLTEVLAALRNALAPFR